MRVVFYLLMVPTALLSLTVFFKVLTGTTVTPLPFSEKVVSILASLLVMGLITWATTLTVQQGRPGLASVIIVLSWILFGAIMLIHGLLTTKSWN